MQIYYKETRTHELFKDSFKLYYFVLCNSAFEKGILCFLIDLILYMFINYTEA